MLGEGFGVDLWPAADRQFPRLLLVGERATGMLSRGPLMIIQVCFEDKNRRWTET